MKELSSMLGGGDRRSIGRVNEVIDLVDESPQIFELLLMTLRHSDAVVRMRCADAIEKISRRHPNWLTQHTTFVLAEAVRQSQQEVRWHLAQIIPRLTLTRAQRARAIEILKSYLADPSGIVRVNAMQALADLSEGDAKLRRETARLIKRMTENGSPAVKARRKRLLKRL